MPRSIAKLSRMNYNNYSPNAAELSSLISGTDRLEVASGLDNRFYEIFGRTRSWTHWKDRWIDVLIAMGEAADD